MTSLRESVFGTAPPVAAARLRTDSLWRLAGSALRLAALLGLTALVLAVAALVVAARIPFDRSSAGAEGAGWIEVHRPFQFYTLIGADLARLPEAYAAERHGEGGGRIDRLTFGALDGSGPYLTLSLYRIGKEARPQPEFSAELDRLAAAAGAYIPSSGSPSPVTTRFGAFEAADLSLAAAGGETPCLGFRSRAEDRQVLRIGGFVCGVAGKPILRDALACIVDRLDLVAGGDDAALQTLFVEAERRRGAVCALPSLTATPAKSLWLDASNAPPPLKRLDR